MISYQGKRTPLGTIVTRCDTSLERPDAPDRDTPDSAAHEWDALTLPAREPASGATLSSPLPLRLDLATHSPTGFEWGYGGSGPAQLALALLADALGDEEQALALYQSFKWQVVAVLPASGWQLSADAVRDVVRNAVQDEVRDVAQSVEASPEASPGVMQASKRLCR
jgi:hypothetical protein